MPILPTLFRVRLTRSDAMLYLADVPRIDHDMPMGHCKVYAWPVQSPASLYTDRNRGE